MTANYNNHFTTRYITHSHSNSHRLTNSSVHSRNNNRINHSRMFKDSESSTIKSSIITISLIRSGNNSVNTSNTSLIKSILTISTKRNNYIINSNNNRSRVSNSKYKLIINLNKLTGINNNSSIHLISNIKCCTNLISHIIFIISKVVCMSGVVSDR